MVAACVVLPIGLELSGLTDSKKISASSRDLLHDQIHNSGASVGIGQASVAEIEDLNILRATMLAMQRAVLATTPSPDYVLIDGNQLPDILLPMRSLVKGDARCHSISAASIIAKVFRDRLMLELDKQFPEYGFGKHKGYGTQRHRESISGHGPSVCHRKSFRLN